MGNNEYKENDNVKGKYHEVIKESVIGRNFTIANDFNLWLTDA
jgi:hypothetical protein